MSGKITPAVRVMAALATCALLTQCHPALQATTASRPASVAPQYTISLGPPGTPVQLPAGMWECEAGSCGGRWRFKGATSTGDWPGGSHAVLAVERFDTGGVIIHRRDTGGSTAGLMAVYAGTMSGDHIQGQANWSWPGHWNNVRRGQFTAKVMSANEVAAVDEGHLGASQVLNNGDGGMGLLLSAFGSTGVGGGSSIDEEDYNRFSDECERYHNDSCEKRDMVRETMMQKGEPVP